METTLPAFQKTVAAFVAKVLEKYRQQLVAKGQAGSAH